MKRLGLRAKLVSLNLTPACRAKNKGPPTIECTRWTSAMNAAICRTEYNEFYLKILRWNKENIMRFVRMKLSSHKRTTPWINSDLEFITATAKKPFMWLNCCNSTINQPLLLFTIHCETFKSFSKMESHSRCFHKPWKKATGSTTLCHEQGWRKTREALRQGFPALVCYSPLLNSYESSECWICLKIAVNLRTAPPTSLTVPKDQQISSYPSINKEIWKMKRGVDITYNSQVNFWILTFPIHKITGNQEEMRFPCFQS